jgi:hypothetical protein
MWLCYHSYGVCYHLNHTVLPPIQWAIIYMRVYVCVCVNSVKLCFGQNESLHWTIQLSYRRPMSIDLMPLLLFFYPLFQLMMHMETCIQHVTDSQGHVDWFSSFPFSFFLCFLAGVAQIHLFGIFSFSLVSGLTYWELHVVSPKTMSSSLPFHH